MISDQIGDLLTRIRNASRVGKEHCQVPHSKLKENILIILQQEGYINSWKTLVRPGKRTQLQVNLKYKDKVSVIREIERVSKPGLRTYVKKKNLPQVLQGIGIAIVSTSKGLMTNNQSRKQNLGGEVIAYVW